MPVAHCILIARDGQEMLIGLHRKRECAALLPLRVLSAPMTFSYWVLRALITGVVLASAVGKSLDLAGFVEVLATYHTVPAGWVWPLA